MKYSFGRSTILSELPDVELEVLCIIYPALVAFLPTLTDSAYSTPLYFVGRGIVQLSHVMRLPEPTAVPCSVACG